MLEYHFILIDSMLLQSFIEVDNFKWNGCVKLIPWWLKIYFLAVQNKIWNVFFYTIWFNSNSSLSGSESDSERKSWKCEMYLVIDINHMISIA